MSCRSTILRSTIAVGAAVLASTSCSRGPSDHGGVGPLTRTPLAAGAPRPDGIRVAEGLELHGFASDPLLANPVALTVDDRGRVLVVETHRYRSSVFDVTLRPDWTRDDLALRTVDERRAFLARTFEGTPEVLTAESELVRLLVDLDGDGSADRSDVLVDDFREPAAGTAAGILSIGGDVWFGCVPDLWRMHGASEVSFAVSRERLLTGFGVHVGITGHDLHGLVLGPDGRLYFSMGDRGAHVVTREGATIALPDTGAVFRCELDGSGLEVFATGLRNPQELAFDAAGELFTADNDTAGEDRSRVLHIVAGGDYGWRASYQHMPGFGPWVQERVWEGGIDGCLPSAGFAAQGPSGLDFHPGTGFDPRESGRFVLCDFPKGVLTFGLEPRGASFAVAEPRWILEGIWAPDATFGPDGALWVADWVGGWDRPEAGRVHRVLAPGVLDDPAVVEVRALLREGFAGRATAELTNLLGHVDLRVRQRAHLELAARGAEGRAAAQRALEASPSLLARRHALWALGALARRDSGGAEAITAALGDPDAVVRTQAARICGELGLRGAVEPLRRLLRDGGPRERFESVLALGRVGGADAVPDVLVMVRADGTDAFLRHGAVEALRRLATPAELVRLQREDALEVRRAALLALRRQEAAEIAVFLDDPAPELRVEAARAIHDVPIAAALPALAERAVDPELPLSVRARAVNAAFRVGRSADADRLAEVVRGADSSTAIRVQALRALEQWGEPDPFDVVVGLWRPITPRDPGIAASALARCADAAVATREPDVLTAFVDAARRLRVDGVAEALVSIAVDESQPAGLRAAALEGLGEIRWDGPIQPVVEAGLSSRDAVLVEGALRLVDRVIGDRTVELRVLDLARGAAELRVRQLAIRALGRARGEAGERFLREALAQFTALPAELHLDVLEAAAECGGEALTQAAAALDPPASAGIPHWRSAIAGGDAERGRRVFAERAQVSCQRCHAVGGVGGDVGPALDHVGRDRTPEELLESVLDPGARIVDGYPPAMPEVARAYLSRADLRDLIAYLRSLR